MTFTSKAATVALAVALTVAWGEVGAESQKGGLPGLAQDVAELRAELQALQSRDANTLFIEHDIVAGLDPVTGTGVQVGTAAGKIRGASITTFQLTITAFPSFTFDNRVGITDTDGDQIIFRHVGTGRIVGPPLQDPTGPAGAPIQVFDGSFLASLTGTHEVVATSGKYVTQYPIGQVFQSRSVMSLPPPVSGGGAIGSAYVEVTMQS